MSPRNFQRVFTKAAGKSPARYVEQLRIETARRLLERTTQSMDEIAFCHKPETTWGTMNDDVLALLNPKFKRANFCSVILNSAWRE